MIYLFYGNSECLLSETINKWKRQFAEKYGDFQLTHVKDYSQIGGLNIEDSIVSEGLFAEKKLIILDDIPASAQTKDKDIQAFQEKLLTLISRKTENVILVFSSLNPDKRGKFFKYLQKLSKTDTEKIQIKEYTIKDDGEGISLFQQRYPNTEYNILSHVLNLKSGNIEKAVSELNKLSIAHDTITVDLVNQNIVPELEQSIFIFIENLLYNRKKQSLNDMRIILEQSEIMSFYYGLLSNMRTVMYILLFLKLKKPKPEIIKELHLGNRGFLVDKYANLNYKKISILYKELCELDSNMKSGKLGYISEAPLADALEVLILKQ